MKAAQARANSRRLIKRANFVIEQENRMANERLKALAGMIPNQASLDKLLLSEENTEKRMEMFEKMKPYLTFRDPQPPTTLIRPSLIIQP